MESVFQNSKFPILILDYTFLLLISLLNDLYYLVQHFNISSYLPYNFEIHFVKCRQTVRIIVILWAPSGIFLWESFLSGSSAFSNFGWMAASAKVFTLSWEWSLSYRKQFNDLLCKSINWFLYHRDLRHERANNAYIEKKRLLYMAVLKTERNFWGEQIECRGATKNFSGQGSFLGVRAYPGLQRRRAMARKISEKRLIFSARTFCLVKKKKSFDHSGFQLNRWNNEKVTVNSKYYQEHQRTCDILIKFTYLMVSKLLYLLMDCETLLNCPRWNRSEV